MTTANIYHRVICLALAALFLNSAARGEDMSAARHPGTDVLSIQINVPTAWLLLGDDKMSDVLQQQVRQKLLQAGCHCSMNFFGLADNPADAAYLLTIDLKEWSLDALGYVHCSLAARLKTPKGNRDLGVYASATGRWSFDMPPFRLSSAFEYAAEDSIERLSGDIAHSGLLAGLPSQS